MISIFAEHRFVVTQRAAGESSMMASRRKTLSHEASCDMRCRTLDTPAILGRGAAARRLGTAYAERLVRFTGLGH